MQDINKISEYLEFLKTPHGTLYASDSKFHRTFGRDSVISCLELLPWISRYAKNTILELSELQGENGQIIHETLKQTMWDALDSTPLYLVLVSEYYKKNRSLKFIKKILPNIEKAVFWINDEGDKDGDGFLEYYKNGDGLTHHSWKDSETGTSNEDGSLPKYPITPSETQGYLYKAYLGVAEIYNDLGRKRESKELTIKASSLKKKFNKYFWMEDKGFFATALDKNKKQVTTIASNTGHVIWSGIAEDEKATKSIQRMLEKDILTSVGVRTLSDQMGNYLPKSYHNGSIWPFDNWFFVEGLDKYGYVEEAHSIRLSILKTLDNLGDPYECYTFINGKVGLKFIEHGKTLRPERIQAWTVGAMYSFVKKTSKIPIVA